MPPNFGLKFGFSPNDPSFFETVFSPNAPAFESVSPQYTRTRIHLILECPPPPGGTSIIKKWGGKVAGEHFRGKSRPTKCTQSAQKKNHAEILPYYLVVVLKLITLSGSLLHTSITLCDKNLINRPFQMRAWNCITSYPLRCLPYLAYDNVNPAIMAMVNSMMLRSSM